jgi:hypothetical protein
MEITKMWIILIKTQHLREKSAIFCFFNLKMDCSSVTTDLTSKRTQFSESSWNSAYSSRFRLKNSKIVENRRTIVQRNSDFWPCHGFHFKSNSPTQNLMEITKMWIILIKTQHLREKSAIFCFFNLKMDCSSVTTDLTSKTTRFSESSWNSAYSSRFRLKNSKIVENRRTIVQRNSDFLPCHGFHFKSNSPTQNLMEITKMWTILIKTQHLKEKTEIFCLFDLKIGWSSVTTDLT